MQTGLYDLLAPQFLTGLQLPSWLEEILNFLRLESMEQSWDDTGVVYYGNARFVGNGAAQAPTEARTPSGTLFRWEDVNLQYRLTVPRTRSDFIFDALNTVSGAAPAGSPLVDVDSMLDRMEVVPAAGPSDYPGVSFRLELLFSAISIYLPKEEFLPAKVASDGWLVRDQNVEQVVITLPKIALVLSQDHSLDSLSASFEGWGTYSLDDAADPEAGELIRMEPSLCLHQSRVIGFGLEKIVLDLSDSFTPPEILEQFGTGDEFEGLWIPHVRFFISLGRQTGLAFDARANDLLVDFEQGVSGEFGFDLIHRNRPLEVEPIIYQGEQRRSITRGTKSSSGSTTTVTNSRASVAADGELQLSIRGGYPPFQVEVKLGGNILNAQAYQGDNTRLVWPFNNPGTGPSELLIKVTDSSNPAYTWNESIQLELLPAGTSTGSSTEYPAPTLAINSATAGYTLRLQAVQNDVSQIFLQVDPAPVDTISLDGTLLSVPVDAQGNFSVSVVADGSNHIVLANWTVPPTDQLKVVHFPFSVPSESQMTATIADIESRHGAQLLSFIQRAIAAGQQNSLTIEGNASYDGVWQESYNQGLSDRRVTALITAMQNIAVANSLNISFASQVGHATKRARADLPTEPNRGTLDGCGTFPHGGSASSDYDPACYRNAMVSFSGGANASVSVTVSRPAPTTTEIRTPFERGPQPTQPAKPPIFKSIGARVRLERNLLVLAELHGQFDLRTASENAAGLIQAADAGGTTGANNTIANNIEAQAGASEDGNVTPQDGILDYKLQMSYDSAIKRITYTLALGFDQDQDDGFVHLKAFDPVILSNTFGSLLTFAPLIASSLATAVDAQGGDAVVPYTLAAAEVGVGIALGATGVFETERITLYGAELNINQVLVEHYDVLGAPLAEMSMLFDYAIDFKIDLDLGVLKIQSTDDAPLRVRYNALGFKLDFLNDKYIPTFDTSKGYEFAMADPGLLTVSDPLGKILKVVGARVSRVNPLTIEFDLAINANLGIVSVDQIKVKIPVDPPGIPSIIPTAATVNIPGTFIGSGYIDLSNGIQGSIDITIVPIKLRLMADIGINPIEANGRKVTAFYLGLGVEFPAPIPIGGSGMGLYGVLGLFGMHYKRDENAAANVPALDWLNTKVNGDPTKIVGWKPDLDKWAFGAGAVLGTIDSGFTLNLKGMLLLELPGPRILVLVKLQMLTFKPDTEGPVDNLGILAVVDLDFNLRKLTIGVLIAYEVKDLISLQVPVEASFAFDNAQDWHFYMGRISAPVSAEVLGIVKATGYFMIDGDQITGFPGPGGPTTLQGLAIALGLKAAVILGDESSGLYLKVSAGFDAGLTFSPLHVYGVLELRGKLRLFIVSISAWATLQVEAPDPTYLHGEACGEVDFFFFSIKGCVSISIGSKQAIAEAESLLLGMVLQSRSPALVLGQGSDRPIDGSLGNAKEVSSVSSSADNDLLRVPIDSIPLLKFRAPALLDPGFSTFTDTVSQAPKLSSDGWIKQGENREVRYTLSSLSISPALKLDGLGDPPASWIANKQEAEGIDTNIDLALLSWIPDATPHAIQRSDELTERIKQRWGNLCDEVAPEACQLWTFNEERLGYSKTGWFLEGSMWPDPPDTNRSEEPGAVIHVYEDRGKSEDSLIEQLAAMSSGLNVEHAKVIGDLAAGLIRGQNMPKPGTDTTNSPRRFFGKVLELPFASDLEANTSLKLDQFADLIVEEPQRIVVDCQGAITKARLLVAMPENVSIKLIEIRTLDEDGGLLDSFPAADVMQQQNVNGGNAPQQWVDSTGPWYADVIGVLSYLDRKQSHLQRVLLAWEAVENTSKIELIVHRSGNRDVDPPSMLLCIIELCKFEESQRVIHETKVKKTMIETVENALAGGQLRPLLEPDTRYTISVGYDSEARERDESGAWDTKTATVTQRFTFMTDDTSPAKLDPWVLMTSPYDGNPYHFTEDAVEIYFNDLSVVQLYEKYGETLKAVLRKANGEHAADEPTIDLASLLEVDAAILTPFEETLRAIVDDKGCVDAVESEKHRKFVLNIPLDRGTEYLLDVEIDEAAAPVAPGNPLFRVAFKTSRYASAEELASILSQSYINHRRLENPLAILSDGASDQDFENALIDSGLEAVQPAGHPSCCYLWEPAVAGHELTAILIDSPEPLWRSRKLPVKETVHSDSGDMEHWVLEERIYLKIEERVSAVVNKIVHSPGGTRALVYLSNAAGQQIDLGLVQIGIVLDGSVGPESVHSILSTEIPSVAPWELNEITD